MTAATAMFAALAWLGCNGPEGGGKDGPGPNPPVVEVPPTWTDGYGASGPGADVPGRECDAGDAAWVARTLPLVWGRKAHGAAEIGYWAQMAATYGRADTVRAMTYDLEYYQNWLDWMTDALYVARTGDKEFGDCFEEPKMNAFDGSLAAMLRDNGPTEATYARDFDMADVIVDGLVADDLSVVYRAHLFARMQKPTTGANVDLEQLEYNRRVNFGELFYRTYLGRSLVCMTCHNSEFSTTDSDTPALDRTWQIPGNFETAILGAPGGRSAEEAYAMFRYDAVNASGDSGFAPWGINGDCGTFITQNNITNNDLLDQDVSWFIRDLGPSGSMYDVERDLAAGVDALDGVGLTVGPDGTVGGEEAFAYLLATSVASQVWATATGYDLVVAHWFPRNEGQMIRLRGFADTLVKSRFSLRSLLVAVTTDPYYNQGLPSTCSAIPYGLAPVFDPWVTADEDPYRRGNGASDMVHRLPPRALLRSAHVNLGWSPRINWFKTNFFGVALNPEEELFQSGVGVFLRESDPGHRGSDFQGLLAFETELGTCAEPAPGGVDYVDRLLSDAATAGGTVGDVAAALKDRLVQLPVAADEQVLVEGLLQATFADPASAIDEDRLRLWCGTLLMSPQFQLVTDPEAPGPPPSLGSDALADCERTASLMGRVGIDVGCDGTTLSE